MQDAMPEENNIILNIIPKVTTGRIQPLDVYGFRIWKNYVRLFSDDVLLQNCGVNFHLRNKILLNCNTLYKTNYFSEVWK